jgi:nucleoside-diphosphate-sugar epimerase
VVKANLAAAKGEVPVAVLNVGTGIPSDTMTLAKRLEEYLGVTADLGYGEQRAGDLEYSLLDGSDLEALLGQTVSLEAGLKETAAWFKAN